MKTQWKDTTNYGDRHEDRTQRDWSWQTKGLRIKIFCDVDYAHEWYVTCNRLGMNCVSIGTGTDDEAKHKAVEAVRKQVDEFRTQLETYRG